MKKKIEKVQEGIEEELMALKDVTGVYIGEKNKKSVIKVGVKKMNPDIVKAIPKKRDGYNIVIEETGEFNALSGN